MPGVYKRVTYLMESASKQSSFITCLQFVDKQEGCEILFSNRRFGSIKIQHIINLMMSLVVIRMNERLLSRNNYV